MSGRGVHGREQDASCLAPGPHSFCNAFSFTRDRDRRRRPLHRGGGGVRGAAAPRTLWVGDEAAGIGRRRRAARVWMDGTMEPTEPGPGPGPRRDARRRAKSTSRVPSHLAHRSRLHLHQHARSPAWPPCTRTAPNLTATVLLRALCRGGRLSRRSSFSRRGSLLRSVVCRASTPACVSQIWPSAGTYLAPDVHFSDGPKSNKPNYASTPISFLLLIRK